MRVQDLLCVEQTWTRGAEARTPTGEAVHAEDERAVCWCLLGAINLCYPEFYAREIVIRHVVREIAKQIGSPIGIDEFNDRLTFEQVREFAKTMQI